MTIYTYKHARIYVCLWFVHRQCVLLENLLLHETVKKKKKKKKAVCFSVYCRPSVARTLMARLLVSNSFLGPLKRKHIAADLG